MRQLREVDDQTMYQLDRAKKSASRAHDALLTCLGWLQCAQAPQSCKKTQTAIRGVMSLRKSIEGAIRHAQRAENEQRRRTLP